MKERFNQLSLSQQTVMTISGVFALLFLPYSFVEITNNALPLGIMVLLTAIASFVIAVLSWQGKSHRLTGNALLGIMLLLLLGVNIATAGENDAVPLGVPVVIFLVTVIARGWQAFTWAALVFSVIPLVAVLRGFGLEPVLTVDPEFREYPLVRLPVIISSLALLVGLLYQQNNAYQRRKVKEAAERLREERDRTLHSEKRFRDFAHLAADCLWQTDEKGCVTYLSPGFERLFFIAPEKILGLSLEQIFYDNAPPDANAADYLGAIRVQEAFSEDVFHWKRLDGKHMTLLNSGKPIIDEEGIFQGYRGVLRDYTEQTRVAKELHKQASMDELTGLLNRRAFLDRVSQTLVLAKDEQKKAAMAYIDLDDFKEVNDRAGHAEGDKVLAKVAEIFRHTVRKTDAVGRIGGDEFCIFFEDQPLSEALMISERIIARIKAAKLGGPAELQMVGASIGLIGEEPVETLGVKQWLLKADEAVYRAKHHGKNQVWLLST